jgi:hypothetical protein
MFLSDLISFIKDTQKEKSQKAFPWADTELGHYLSWAFSKNCLFVESDEKGINGLLIAYPINWVFTNDIKSLLPSNAEFTPEQENEKHLCIMDGIFNTKEARKNITIKFTKRFPNWQNQTKWAVRKGNVTELNNRYIQLTGNIL